MGMIVVNGSKYPLVADTKLWTETGMEFKPGNGARKRTSIIDLCIWHYTGGEGNAEQLFSVLDSRELGVEFFIDRSGMIYQFCDPSLVDTFDAGHVNSRSVGVEIANYGHRANQSDIPKAGKSRPIYDAIINNHDYDMAKFWPQQMAAALSLADAISTALSIPRRVPLNSSGNVLSSTMNTERLESFSGHVGHYHISSQKIDPGLDLLDMFRVVFE